MIDGYGRGLTLAAAIGAAVTAGVYFAFSTFIMTGLRRLSHAQSIAAMNAINKAAPNPLFMLALFGTAIACVVLAIHGLRNRDGATVWLMVGCALYLISALVTVAYHIPHNDALMTVDPDAAGAGTTWSHFVAPWLAWNHVRTVTSLAGTVSLVLALRAT
jgi:uncharacterized membrane protein